MMGYMDNKNVVCIKVENKYFSSWISHEIIAMWYIIKLLSCNTPTDDIYYHIPYFDMFVCCYWYITEMVRNTAMQYILSLVEDPDGILMGKPKTYLFWLDFGRRAFVILSSVIFGLSLFPFSEDAYTPVVCVCNCTPVWVVWTNY